MNSLLQIYRHRALAEILVGRELKARYRGTVLGFLWSFANPLIMMSIYVLVFSVYMRIDVPNYPAFVICSLLPWTAFSAGVLEGMNSIISNGAIIKKVHLPTEVFPFVAVTSNGVHFLFSIPVLLLIMLVSGMSLTPSMLMFPVLLALQFLFTFGLALFLSSLAVQFRDLVHIVPNLMLVWFYLTPVFYGLEMVPERFRPLAYLNPMTWLIQGYRDIFFHHHMPHAGWTAAFLAVSLFLVSTGMWLFHRRSDLYPELV